MTGPEIKNKIDTNNKTIEEWVNPRIFTLNDAVRTLLEENERLQKECPHIYENGICKFCYKEEKK